MGRVAFLVDGFNLYHSLRDAEVQLGGRSTRWLDLRAFCASYLPLLGRAHSLGPVHYFSALAKHRQVADPRVTARHLAYIRCLEATGVVVHLSRFKRRDGRCPSCGAQIVRHEEKETDVAVAVALLETSWGGTCDIVVLVTGDSDIVPAIRAARRAPSEVKVIAALPFNRHSLELRAVADATFGVSKEAYARHQLPDPFVLPDGRRVAKPAEW